MALAMSPDARNIPHIFYPLREAAHTVCHFYVGTFRHYIPFYCRIGA